MDKIERLKKKCFSLKASLREVACEFVELEITHENLINELARTREELDRELKKFRSENSESSKNEKK